MTQSIPALTVGNVAVRQHAGLFSLNDLHQAAGNEDKHRPTFFLRNDQTQALIEELKTENLPTVETVIGKGKAQGTYACRELVIAYAAWISAAFHLKVIRVFLYVAAPTTPYSVHPGQTLSAEQAEALRNLLTSQVQKLPKAQQGKAMVQGWSKLKAHFGRGYRHIPAGEFHEAVSIIARHTAEWELVDEASKAGTVNETVEKMVEWVNAKNGYPIHLFVPVYEAIHARLQRNMEVPRLIDAADAPAAAQPPHGAERLQAILGASLDAGARVQQAVAQGMLAGGSKDWSYQRWILAFAHDAQAGAVPYLRQMDQGSFVATWPRLVKDVASGECMCTSAELLDMAAACMQRLQQRGGPGRLAA